MKIIVKTYAGLEEILASEIKDVFGVEPEILRRAVSFNGSATDVYKANYLLRTALRILVPLHHFQVHNEKSLYKNVYEIPWEKYFDVSQTFAVDAFAHSELFTNSHFLALKTKDAIADRFRDRIDERPSVDKVRPDVVVNIHVADRNATLSLDSSGSSLHLRGFRVPQHDAPISEVLAAGIIYLSGWDKKAPLLDPMCGSGTICAEAAMMAHQVPAGFFRQFAFQQWKDFDQESWTHIKLQHIPQYNAALKISGSDKDSRAIQGAQEWLEHSPLKPYIQFTQQDLFTIEDIPENTWIITNPPYGERLQDDQIRNFYGDLGRWLKFKSGVKNAWIFSAFLEGLKLLGLKPSRKFNLFNGPLESKLVGLELYRGTKLPD